MAPEKKPVKRTPRKRVAKAKEYVEEKVIPVLKEDAKKIWVLDNWIKYVIGAVIIFILLKIFVIDGCRGVVVTKNEQKVKALEQDKASLQRSVDSAKQLLTEYDKAFDEALSAGKQATSERISAEIEGEEKRQQIKIITDETIKRIKDPRTTDADRDAILDELFKSREAAKMHSGN